MIALVDVDGVLADFVGSYLGGLELATGRRYLREEIDSFEITEALRWELAGTGA